MASMLPSPPRHHHHHPHPFFKPQPSLLLPTFSQRFRTSGHRLPPLRSSPLPSSSALPFDQRMHESLAILDLMRSQSITPDPSLLCTLLKSCADAQSLHFGKLVHEKAILFGLHTDTFVSNSLIHLYSKCGRTRSAQQLFDEMPLRNVVSWTTLISITGDLDMGIRIHEDVVKDGCDGDEFVVVALIDMYAKCGSVGLARKMFDKITEPSVEACTAMIEGYCANDRAKDAINLIRQTLRRYKVSKVAERIGFATMVRPCIVNMGLRQGQEIHAHLIKFGHKPGMNTLTLLVELYSKCGKMMNAYDIFNKLVVKDVVLWGKMISGFVHDELYGEALKVYAEMTCSGCGVNASLVSFALKACIGLLSLEEGKQIHGRVIKDPRLLRISVIHDLSKLYECCGKLEEVHKLMKKLPNLAIVGGVERIANGAM
ncbi:pentatricopeptide repeat-containing protein At4g39530-like isoform X2 [Dioscorea cayenensis subsp. rotundata]|uniref:Pentatricopeptide repeat-containing protein At4g39530-like isoform X2 n=1 Tax=Dioscorea cayennensis subsp. rotundata TaxID=55577 RepID=A0AB40AXP5_DIOCR|nr:pentatricopeptide repeat-containing protein At4g39530-like isoform X2 [Dioscorea cayenensis subsp. rotundata]